MQIVLKYDNVILYANIMAVVEDFVVSKKINYTCIASSQNRFVLSNSFTTVNLSKYKKVLCFLCKGKKVSHSSFYENK